jgi:small subunit ribosomal protein S17
VAGEERVETQSKTEKRNKKTLIGTVVSNKMEKTIVVRIERRKLHPLYKKYITRTKKIKAHDEGNLCQIGDLVKVVESRPLSKDKRWSLLEVLEKAK